MSPQVRRIAILVTSLDSAAGRQLLLAMPSPLARDVRKAMASLTSVDPEEQRQVLAEFRSQALSSAGGAPATSAADRAPAKRTSVTSATPRPAAVVDSDPFHAHLGSATDHASAQAATQAAIQNAGQEPHAADDDFSYVDGAKPWAQLDVAALTDLLRGERPLVIAVVLSQLQPRHAARLLEQFPREQHRAVLAHLTSLGSIDPEAMQAIDEHLASRIADYHHRRESQSESTGRMQELLAAASPELRNHWQEIIADSDRQLAKRLGIAVTPKPALVQSESVQRTRSQSDAAADLAAHTITTDLLAGHVVTTADAHSSSQLHRDAESEPVVLPFPGRPQTSERRGASSQSVSDSATGAQATERTGPAIATLDQILELPPRTIARVLSAADGEVVLLALAGATPGFMQRFTAMLEKPDARALQARLGALGAINLQDIDEAQRRLCELASHIVAQMRPRRPSASTARAAA